MKKKSKLIILLGLIFIMLFSNVFTVSATESNTPDEDEDYHYTDIKPDKDGNYIYMLKTYTGTYSGKNGYLREFKLSSKTPLVIYTLGSSDDYVYYVASHMEPNTNYESGYYSAIFDTSILIGKNSYCEGFGSDFKIIWTKDDDYFSSSFVKKEKGGYLNTTIPVFSSPDAAYNYLKNGDKNGIINGKFDTEIDEQLYLKNIRWKTEALTGSGGKEDCYCFMSWDTNNLLTGDTVDIRVDSWYQHYILGKKVSGVYDVITNKSVDDFSSTSWSHAYSYGLDLLKGSLYFDYLTFPMLYANSIDNSIKNIYNGGVSAMYLRLNRLDSKTGKLRQGLWVKVNFKESSVSYPDIDSIQAGTIDEETGIFTPNNNTDYGENGYGINGETGNIVPPNGGGNFGDIDSIDELGEYLFNSLKKLFASLGQFPTFLSSVFSFIPLPIIALIGGSIVVVIILRILGR